MLILIYVFFWLYVNENTQIRPFFIENRLISKFDVWSQ